MDLKEIVILDITRLCMMISGSNFSSLPFISQQLQSNCSCGDNIPPFWVNTTKQTNSKYQVKWECIYQANLNLGRGQAVLGLKTKKENNDEWIRFTSSRESYREIIGQSIYFISFIISFSDIPACTKLSCSISMDCTHCMIWCVDKLALQQFATILSTYVIVTQIQWGC